MRSIGLVSAVLAGDAPDDGTGLRRLRIAANVAPGGGTVPMVVCESD
jgi:hypothetical protein